MRRFVILTIIAMSTGCSAAPPPAPQVVTVSDTFCARTTTYRATEAQRAAFHKDEATWRPLVEWVLAINDQRAKHCR